MDERECAIVYKQLVEILNEFRLGWIAEQVEVAIRTGKSIEEESSKKELTTRTEAYTAQEQLLLLIDAAEHAVVDTTEIEGELNDFLKQERERLNTRLEMVFLSEQENVATLKISSDSLAERRKASAELRQLLNELRKEAVNRVD